MRSTSAVPRVISQLEDIFRMHHPTKNNYCIHHNEKCEKPRTKIFADRITCFLPQYYNPLFKIGRQRKITVNRRKQLVNSKVLTLIKHIYIASRFHPRSHRHLFLVIFTTTYKVRNRSFVKNLCLTYRYLQVCF